MPTEQQITDAYTARALRLIRFSNGVTEDALGRLRGLARDIRRELADEDLSRLGRRELKALLTRVSLAVVVTFDAISTHQTTQFAQLLRTESKWAAKAGALGKAASETALTTTATTWAVLGLPLAKRWEHQGAGLANKVAAAIRNAATVDQDARDLLALIVGKGRRGREKGGILGTARRQAATLTETATDEAAYAGRKAAWKAGGINALKWHSILDSRTTPGCAVRAGKLYDLDFQPIGHSVPIDKPPPRHWNCRSILVAMKYPEGKMPADGQDAFNETFEQWLERQTQEGQDAMLGVGRADLWRRGVITTRQLIDQRGHVLTLGELQKLHT